MNYRSLTRGKNEVFFDFRLFEATQAIILRCFLDFEHTKKEPQTFRCGYFFVLRVSLTSRARP